MTNNNFFLSSDFVTFFQRFIILIIIGFIDSDQMVVEQQIEKSGEQQLIESKDDGSVHGFYMLGAPETKKYVYTMQELIDLSSSKQSKALDNLDAVSLMNLVKHRLMVDRERMLHLNKGNKADMVSNAVKQVVKEDSQKKQNLSDFNQIAIGNYTVPLPVLLEFPRNEDDKSTMNSQALQIDSMINQVFDDSKVPDDISKRSIPSENVSSNIDSSEAASNVLDQSDIRSQILSKTKSLQLRLSSMIQKK